MDEQKGATIGARGSPSFELGGGVVRAYEERGRKGVKTKFESESANGKATFDSAETTS